MTIKTIRLILLLLSISFSKADFKLSEKHVFEKLERKMDQAIELNFPRLAKGLFLSQVNHKEELHSHVTSFKSNLLDSLKRDNRLVLSSTLCNETWHQNALKIKANETRLIQDEIQRKWISTFNREMSHWKKILCKSGLIK
jgi:hypothetical protein